MSKEAKIAISSQFSCMDIPSIALFESLSKSNKSGMMMGKLRTDINVAEFSPCAAIPATIVKVAENPIDPNSNETRYNGKFPTGLPITQE